MTPKKPEPLLWLSDARGMYIPRDFAQSFEDRDTYVSNVSADDWAILEYGPEHEHYWDVWNDVEQNARITNLQGDIFRVYQDGDCWLIPIGMEHDEESDFFVWPEEEKE